MGEEKIYKSCKTIFMECDKIKIELYQEKPISDEFNSLMEKVSVIQDQMLEMMEKFNYSEGSFRELQNEN